MHTEIVKITKANQEDILTRAGQVIRSGGLVVFPTETVYGLGANVFDDQALKKIFIAKGRPSDNPIIVHISSLPQLADLVDNTSSLERKLIDKFWPGPLTIIFPKKREISEIVSGGLDTIAVRMPSSNFARKLIEFSEVPIAAPSANTSGRPSSTSGAEAYKDLVGKVDMIIEAGESDIGVESTVVKIGVEAVSILRPGAVTKEMLAEVVTPLPVVLAIDKKDLQSSPGTKYKHYAPEARLEIVNPGKAMSDRGAELRRSGQTVGIICTAENKNLFENYLPNVFNLGDRNNLEEISKSLYNALRFFDEHKVQVILCEPFPEQGLGVAIMDRLHRASTPQN